MKARYLTFFSYIGTSFRSSEKIWLQEGRNYADPKSVQGMLEIALIGLRSLNYPKVVLSSRTDGGVHALNSSAHFDLERFGLHIYEPHNIAYSMNKFFYKHNTPIFIKQCLRVNNNFSARFNAIRRTYLYRFAIIKQEVEVPECVSIPSYIPIEEWRRCHFMRLRNFDIEKLKAGAKYLIGYHDFSTFKRFDKLNQEKHNRREIYSIEVRPGRGAVTSHTEAQKSLFEYWDVEIQGRAFVHNQIRRMLGTLISVAIGKLKPQDIQVMLQVPSKHSWHSFIATGPPDGLYLCNVEYKPDDLIYSETTQTDTSCEVIQPTSTSNIREIDLKSEIDLESEK